MSEMTFADWRKKWQLEGERNRHRVERTRLLIRELKAGPMPEREREILCELRADQGDQYVLDLTNAIRTKRDATPGKRPR